MPWDLCHSGISREAEALHADLPSLKEGVSLCLTHHQGTPPQPQTLKEQENSVKTQATCLIPETGGEITKCEPRLCLQALYNPVRCPQEPLLLLLSTEGTPSKGTQDQQRNCEH